MSQSFETARAATLDALTAWAEADPSLSTCASRTRLVAHGHAACTALGVDYPISDEGEAQVRALIERAWPA